MSKKTIFLLFFFFLLVVQIVISVEPSYNWVRAYQGNITVHNNYTYYNITQNITNNITNNFTYYIWNGTNITNNITNNFTYYYNTTNNYTYYYNYTIDTINWSNITSIPNNICYLDEDNSGDIQIDNLRLDDGYIYDNNNQQTIYIHNGIVQLGDPANPSGYTTYLNGNMDANNKNISDVDCIELGGIVLCDWNDLNVSSNTTINSIWTNDSNSIYPIDLTKKVLIGTNISITDYGLDYVSEFDVSGRSGVAIKDSKINGTAILHFWNNGSLIGQIFTSGTNYSSIPNGDGKLVLIGQEDGIVLGATDTNDTIGFYINSFSTPIVSVSSNGLNTTNLTTNCINLNGTTVCDWNTITGQTYTAGNYLYLNGNQFNVNETTLNATIDARDSDTTYNSTEPISQIGTTFGLTACPDLQGYVYNTSTGWECQLIGNGSYSNISYIYNIDYTYWNITGSKYMYNNSNILDVNETKLNATIDARDSDTIYNDTALWQNATDQWNYMSSLSNMTDTNCSVNNSCQNIVYYINTTNWDKNVSNDFSGDYNDLTNIPNNTGYNTTNFTSDFSSIHTEAIHENYSVNYSTYSNYSTYCDIWNGYNITDINLSDYYNKSEIDTQQLTQNNTIDSKLNISDQRYNDTTDILWETIGTRTKLKNSSSMVTMGWSDTHNGLFASMTNTSFSIWGTMINTTYSAFEQNQSHQVGYCTDVTCTSFTLVHATNNNGLIMWTNKDLTMSGGEITTYSSANNIEVNPKQNSSILFNLPGTDKYGTEFKIDFDGGWSEVNEYFCVEGGDSCVISINRGGYNQFVVRDRMDLGTSNQRADWFRAYKGTSATMLMDMDFTNNRTTFGNDEGDEHNLIIYGDVNATTLTLNDTTIDDWDDIASVDTIWDIDNHTIINVSNYLEVNGTWINETILEVASVYNNTATDSRSYFYNKTTTTYNGSLSTGGLIGYQAGNSICDGEYTGTHLCQMNELIQTINDKNITTITEWTGFAWYSSGGSKYTGTNPADDCNGFTTASTSNLGSFWKFNQTGGGQGAMVNCGESKSLACCKTW